MSIEQLHQAMVLLHRLGHEMPVCSVQRRINRPAIYRLVGFAGRVFECEDWTTLCVVEGRGGGQVGVVCICLVDAEVAGVDVVDAVAWVDVCEGREAGADPHDVCGGVEGLHGGVVGVEDGE